MFTVCPTSISPSGRCLGKWESERDSEPWGGVVDLSTVDSARTIYESKTDTIPDSPSEGGSEGTCP